MTNRVDDPKQLVLTHGPPNRFLDPFLLGILAERGVSARLNCAADGQSVQLLVSEHDEAKAKQIFEHIILRCKICLFCEAFIKPGESLCPDCGAAADPRDPDEIRAACLSALLELQHSTAEGSEK